MRKLILWMGISVDGFFEGPDGDISWHHVDEAFHAHMNDELRGMGAFLEGRRTWRLMEDYWPAAGEDPEASAAIKDFAGIWRTMPKVVFSRTLNEVTGTAELRREVVPDEIEAMKRAPGGDLVLGGADLARTFQRHGLIDAYQIYVHPEVLGEGHRLFEGGEVPRHLRLEETRSFDNGVVLLRYQVAP